jgi:hypothetical protein
VLRKIWAVPNLPQGKGLRSASQPSSLSSLSSTESSEGSKDLDGGGVVIIIIFKEGPPDAGIVWDTRCSTPDEPSEEGEFEVVGHYVGWTLDVAALYEELEVGHHLVLELLEPLLKLHVVLVGLGVVVLASAGLAPEGLCELDGVVDLRVQNAVPICGLFVEEDGEHAGLYAELDERAAVVGGRGKDAFLSLVGSGGASGDAAEFWPGEVVNEHDDEVSGKNVSREDMTEQIYRLRCGTELPPLPAIWPIAPTRQLCESLVVAERVERYLLLNR